MTSEMSGTPEPEPIRIIREAFEQFRNSVTPDDRVKIECTELKDVLSALLDIQKDLRQRRENRNLRKLHPFVEGLNRYSGFLDTLGNGFSPYLPWIWVRQYIFESFDQNCYRVQQAPIKLMLQITSDYFDAFDKLIVAYGRIAETIPRLENLGDAFKESIALRTRIALYYADILDFHHRAYKFIRKRPWKLFFCTLWNGFGVRFNSILASMAAHRQQFDQEADTIDIIESKQQRERLAALVTAQERERIQLQRQSVIAWLALDSLPQDDHREILLRDCLQGSCDWIIKQQKVASWIEINSEMPVVWLYGKPGKSVICASLVDALERKDISTFFYFCKHHQADTLSQILKTLVLNIIKRNSDLTAIAFTEFVEKYHEPSLRTLRMMLIGSRDKPGLLRGIPNCRIIIDGLDGCDPKEQKCIIEDLFQMVSVNSKETNCKILISSRDVQQEISSALRRKRKGISEVSLSEEHEALDYAIQSFVERRLKDFIEDRVSLQVEQNFVEEILHLMITKANGMFLWAKLVLDSLFEVDSLRELHQAITSMPEELPELYTKILRDLTKDCRADRVMKILAWLAFARRPLKRHELLHGVTITAETPIPSKWDVLDKRVIDRCKPLIEELPDGSIALMHFTVEEYLKTDGATHCLDSATWEETIAFTCITVLRYSLCLVDPGIPQLNQLLMILQGSCALLLYAIDFWLDHLLVCANTTKLHEQSSLARALNSLQVLHDKLCSKFDPHASKKAASRVHISKDSRLDAIAHLAGHSLCASIVKFRADCDEKSASNGQEFEELALKQDKTLFSTLSQQYNKGVYKLLSESFSSDDIPKDQLDRFREQYLQMPFRCRFTPCTWASLGFASEALRMSHEEIHVRRLFCDKKNCSRSRIGFRKQRDLAAHMCTYHEQESILIPPRVRTTFNAHTLANETSTSLYGGHSLPDGNHPQTFHTTTQEDVIRYETYLPFDAVTIEKAHSQWENLQSQQDSFAVLRNKNLKASLEVNLVCTFEETSTVQCVDVSPDDLLIAVGCGDTSAGVFDIRNQSKINQHTISSDNFLQRRSCIQAIRFVDNGRSIIVGMDDGRLILWEVWGLSRELKGLEAHQQSISHIHVARDGYTVATCSGSTIKVYDLAKTARSSPQITFDSLNTAFCVAISPDSELIAAGCADNSIYVYSMWTGSMLRRLDSHRDAISSIEFSLDGRTLLSASRDQSIMVWDINLADVQKDGSAKPLKQLNLHRDAVSDCSMTIDGRWIVSCSMDDSVIFWDAETTEPHLMLVGHTASVVKLALGHSSRILATASGDGTIKVWSYET
ncbi:hypothetical protein F4777DRAFT_601066 [Nemania sp. FL0916]|nr:hypothetical protein F4777DRAFT_601066 [Nemania sp. FL0916]